MITRFIEAHRITFYFILAYAITWVFWIPIAYHNTIFGIPTDPLIRYILYIATFAGGFGPLLAGLIMTGISSGTVGIRKWFLELLHWRIGWRWWVIVVCIPIAFYGSIAMVTLMLGGSVIMPLTSVSLGGLVGRYVSILFFGGGNEEPGWRGYAQPQLQNRLSLTGTTLVLGFFWGLWHLPRIFTPGASQYGTSVIGYIFTVIVLTFIYTLVYEETRSVPATMVMHALFNFFAVFVLSRITGPLYNLTSAIAITILVTICLIRFSQKERNPFFK